MKEITILSGKGGAGKTSITAALAAIAENAVFCDNDVDAADLHLILRPDIKEEYTFYGAWMATIDSNKCTLCGICKEECRFDAIHYNSKGDLEINPYQCEGCRLCERLCPAQAITSQRSRKNKWYVSETRFGKMVHARMGPGEENSGKLVSQVRKRAKEIAKQTGADYIINDGPPGIGCSAISSLSGTHIVILVIEPTRSGFHDIKRLVELTANFKVRLYAILNKANISEEIASEIKNYLKSEDIPVIANIPLDKDMVRAMIHGKSMVEYKPDSITSQQLIKAWKRIQK